MCSKGGRGFGGQAGVRTSSNGLPGTERQADGSGRDTQAGRLTGRVERFGLAVGGGHGLREGARLGGIDAGWTSVAPEQSKRR